MMRRIAPPFFCLCLCLGLAAARAAAPVGSAARSAKAPAKPARLSDADLEKAIRARFAGSKINSNHFQVRVQGGTATLEGKTDVIQHKGTATRLAKSAGAAVVVNRIQVSQAARDRANANLAKGRRRAQVKRDERAAQTR
jgi:hypothetical protein